MVLWNNRPSAVNIAAWPPEQLLKRRQHQTNDTLKSSLPAEDKICLCVHVFNVRVHQINSQWSSYTHAHVEVRSPDISFGGGNVGSSGGRVDEG